MLFETTMPVIMITPMSDMMFSVLSGQEQNEQHAGQPRRNRHEDDEWIDERGELRHQDQIDQQDRKNQADGRTA